MYHIVDFLDTGDTEVVPSSWVKDGRSLWPPFKVREKCNRVVMRGDPPDESWPSHTIRIRATKNTFSEAWLLLPRALQTSDLQTEDDEDNRPAYKKRKKRVTYRLFDSESEDDDCDIPNKQPRGKITKAPLALAPPPAIAPPAVISPPAATRPAVYPGVHKPTSSMAPPNQPRINNQPLCDQILREILNTMETIKQQQKLILLQMQTNYPHTLEVPDVSGFPLTSLNELAKLEESIAAQGDTYRRKLVTYFGLAGGLTVKESVWRIMTKLMTNGLAKQINWRGLNGKYAFEQLAIKDVVLKSIRHNRNTASALDGETEKYIKRWLQLASDRDGGRRERALKQKNSS